MPPYCFATFASSTISSVVGEASGHVLQRRADAERALLHRLLDQLLHLLEIVGRGRLLAAPIT